MKQILFAFGLCAALAACQAPGNPAQDAAADGPDSAIATLKDSINYYHDVATMPYMADMKRLKRRLNAVSDSLSTAGKNELPLDEVRAAVQKLDNADAFMMEWMANYNGRYDKEQPETAAEYYAGQLNQLRLMKRDIDAALAEAKSVLGQY